MPDVKETLLAQGWARTAIVVLALFLFSFGSYQFGGGVYIALKAEVAQILLNRAWAETVQTKTIQKPWAWADTWPVARLVMPEIDEESIVLSGVSGQALAFGPGWMEKMGEIGAPGVALIAGHKDTHFSYLKYLEVGQKFYVETRDGKTHVFEVTGAGIVDTREALFIDKMPGSHLILSTCYPFDSLIAQTPYRYLVYASRIEGNAPLNP